MQLHLRRSVSHAALTLIFAGVAAQALAQDAPPPDGSHLFTQHRCFACHGQAGNGGVGPGFREDRFLRITDYVIAQILLGRGIMPPFADQLNDAQTAAVATYIRNSWGNNFGPVEPQQVARVRNELQPEQNQSGSSQPHAQ
jgi:mono/diheme cytochrome c family protein